MDVCLYSEVCHLLASYEYKLPIRRLIQELFVDVPLQKVSGVFPSVPAPTMNQMAMKITCSIVCRSLQCLQKYYELDTAVSVPVKAVEEIEVQNLQVERMATAANTSVQA